MWRTPKWVKTIGKNQITWLQNDLSNTIVTPHQWKQDRFVDSLFTTPCVYCRLESTSLPNVLPEIHRKQHKMMSGYYRKPFRALMKDQRFTDLAYAPRFNSKITLGFFSLKNDVYWPFLAAEINLFILFYWRKKLY